MSRYQNLIEIDGGGQGRIYLADDGQAKKKVIIKTVKHDNAGSRRRLQREARLLEEQKHNPFVVRLEATYLNNDPPFIVMEFCAGGSLSEWIFNRRDVRDVVIAMQHAALGLQSIHLKDGFHRDVTPRNMLVSFDFDGSWRIKLIDFGLGQAPNPLQSGSMTRNWGGTPGYIAPEVEAGDDYTWRADIYSLGVVFRELLTGLKTKPIFDFSPPPAALTKLIDEMTAHDPLKRPDTLYIITQLNNYLNKPAVQPQPIQLPQKQGGGLGLLFGILAGSALLLAATANSYDENAGRYRDSQGRFKSGKFS